MASPSRRPVPRWAAVDQHDRGPAHTSTEHSQAARERQERQITRIGPNGPEGLPATKIGRMASGPLMVRREGGKIWSHVRQRWLVETPEETVRQEYLCVLINEYGFDLGQVAEELEVTGRGSGHARADFVIWRTAQDKRDSRNPLIIVECKSDNVTIRPGDYGQGDNYARLSGARFFVTHNSRETKYWRVVHDKMPKALEELSNVPHADASDSEIDRLIAELKVFKEDEFATLLHQCHNVIRNREKLDPAAAFDEIAKILFIKVYVERELRTKRRRKNLFTVEYLDDMVGRHPLNTLFEETKEAYANDGIFDRDEEIRLRPATGRDIVKLLERYNLSDTSEDIKGIAFERFLGRTFRGEIGQFFTPRSIVEFMIRMVEPREGDVICDPASGSGGFLIRFFEIVREQVYADADREYAAYRSEVEASAVSAAAKAEALRKKYDEIQEALDPQRVGSRAWTLANRCIFGTDANERMARTSKMNMIMHGDGHGGVHHHDGFLNVNGIFEGRFDIILTNPPFGSTVEPSDVVHEADVLPSAELESRYRRDYGALYDAGMARVRSAAGSPIASLFTLPRGSRSKVKTEILFLERCLDLLKPGGRLGIVLPEGILNNPSLAYVREFCEDRAYVRAIVSLPPETFLSSGAAVKASLVFLQKFSASEKERFDRLARDAREEAEKASHTTSAGEPDQVERNSTGAVKERRQRVERQARALLKARFSYPVFLYESFRVGINAKGEEDVNELLPGAEGIAGPSVLEQYRAFRADPQAFVALETSA
jgi:type I restriction enzyme M protein